MPIRDDLLQPIAGDNPSGINLRYDPVVEKIKEARREELDAPQGEWKTTLKTAEWPQVIKLASDLLSKRSKDLQVAVWLVEAHIRREGFSQLAPGFKFIRDLLDQFWESLYPELEDGDAELRCGPLDFLGNKLDVPLRQLPITGNKLNWQQYQESRKIGYEADANTFEKQEEREAVLKDGKLSAEMFDAAIASTPMAFMASTLTALHDGVAALDELRDLCDSRFGDEGPSFTLTRKTLDDIAQTVELMLRKKGGAVIVKSAEEEDEPDEAESDSSSFSFANTTDDASFSFNTPPAKEAPAASAGDDEVAASDAAGETAAELGNIEPQSDDDVVRQLGAVCRYLQAKDLADPAPYMIIRGFRWGELRYSAPVLDTSKLVPPPTDVRVELKDLFAAHDWVQLLPAAEKAMTHPCGRGWLDVQRYVILGLEERGFYSAAKAIRDGVKCLLKDLPDLLTANMRDDTPCASAETREWMTSDVLSDKPVLGFLPPPEETPSDSSSSSDDYSSSSDSYSSSDSSTDSSDYSTGTSAAEETPAPEPAAATIEFPPVDENPPVLPDQEPSDQLKELFENAIEAAQNGNVADGLKMISDKLAFEQSERGRFRRRTQMAHLLLMGGHTKVAEPMLSQIASEIEQRRLEEWEEAPVVAYPLELLLRCVASDPDQADKLYARICKLDPVRALNYKLTNA